MGQERRGAPRAAIRLEVEVWGHHGPNKISDLSTRGVFIHTERPSQYRRGDEVELVLKFPTQQEAMLLKAEVSRVTNGGIGVKFNRLTLDQVKVIEGCYGAFRDTR
jgi:hypothetical protein